MSSFLVLCTLTEVTPLSSWHAFFICVSRLSSCTSNIIVAILLFLFNLSGLEVLEVVGEVIGGEGEGGGEAGGEEGTTELREAVALEGDSGDLLGEEDLVGRGEDFDGDGHRLLVGGEEEEVADAYCGSDG